MKRIAVIGPSLADHRLTASDLDRMRAAAPGAEFVVCSSTAEFVAHLSDVDIAAGQVGSETSADLRRLSWFHSWSAGVDHEPVASLQAAGVQITCSKGNGAIPIAEFTIMAILMMARQGALWIDAQRRHAWERRITSEVKGSTLGLIGLGNIGQEIVRRATAFDMICIAVRRDVSARLPEDVRCSVLPPEGMMDMLRAADFVVVAAPLTPATRGLIGQAHFQSMKPTAVYICVSRGAIAEAEALQRALSDGWIAGAWLDAHAVEPLPPDSPFWDLPNTVITPHNAGATLGNAGRAIDTFVENLSLAWKGQPLRNRVEPESSY